MLRPGKLYVIAAPSGTGKTTLVKALIESLPDITVSISYTTRPKRPGEIDGVNYHFITEPEFKKMIDHQDFLEYAFVFQNLYGTSRSWVEKTLKQGQDVILEIDWQGCRQILTLFPESVSIFILPPSLDDLAERLKKRNQDTPKVIEKRLADARETISHIPEFQYLVINADFEHALYDLTTIIKAHRLEEKTQSVRFSKLLTELQKEKQNN
jgi:guanylate kinase